MTGASAAARAIAAQRSGAGQEVASLQELHSRSDAVRSDGTGAA